MARQKSVLVIEDETDIADLVCYHLRNEGYQTRRVEDGERALAEATRQPPDLIILDRMLPKLSGDEVARRLRRDERTTNIPIIMLTAKSEDVDELVGFALGADDYVRKPFSMKLLLARINAVLRRDAVSPAAREILAEGPIRLDHGRHEVTVNEQSVELTATEFRLLSTLMVARGRVMSREQLVEAAIGRDAVVTNRAMDVHVASLRRKLGDAAECIQTIRGVGYAFRSAASDLAEP